MKEPSLQDRIVAHLRSAGRPESSRDLARRFLRIDRGNEETCRLLLTPYLLAVPGVSHRPGEGWSVQRQRAPEAAGTEGREQDAPSSPPETPSRAGAAIGPEGIPGSTGSEAAASLRDFVALASDGGGPGGSGAARAASLLPVVAGEPCQEEHFPAWGLDAEGSIPIDDETADPEGGRARRGVAGRGLETADLQEMVETIGDLPIVCHRAAREVEPIRRACAAAGLPFHPPVVSAARLGHLLLGLKANHAAVDLATALGLESRGPDDCRGRVRLVVDAFLRLAPLLEERGIGTLEALLEYQDMPPAPLDLSPYAFTVDDLRALPAGPGVYRFLDRRREVIYVGKAKNLRARVSSYFTPSSRGTPKGRAILEQVRSLAIDEVASDLEAALLEAALIAENRPRLNRQFEVHERPVPYGPRLNLAVVLRDAAAPERAAATCTIHFLRAGVYLGRVEGLAGRAARFSRVERLLAAGYFPAGSGAPRRRAGGAEEGEGAAAAGHDIDWQLVSSYLRAHPDEVSVLDLDECGSFEEAADRLRVLVGAVAGGERRVVAR